MTELHRAYLDNVGILRQQRWCVECSRCKKGAFTELITSSATFEEGVKDLIEHLEETGWLVKTVDVSGTAVSVDYPNAHHYFICGSCK